VNARGIVSYLDDANRVLSSLLAHDFRRRRHELDFPCAIRLPQIIDNFESYGLGLVPVSTYYLLRADVRVDRYSDAPTFTTEDWAMQLTFGRNGVDNWAYTPQLGIYASSLTRGWRLFSNNPSASIDLDLLDSFNTLNG